MKGPLTIYAAAAALTAIPLICGAALSARSGTRPLETALRPETAVADRKGEGRVTVMAKKLDAKARDALPDADFAEPEKRAYPIEDKAHARNAKARASQAVKAGRMSKAEEAEIDRRADEVLNKKP